MSYTYNNDAELQAIGTVYLVFGIGCLIFFLGGVCALFCCCNQRFRGIERKGYVVNAQPSGQQQPPGPAPGWVAGYTAGDPPPYGQSPPAKY